MVRHNKFEYNKYALYDGKTNISKCLLCEKELKGRSTGNIKRHYHLVHGLNITGNESNVQHIGKTTKRKWSNLCTIAMTKNEFMLCCVGLATVKNIPLKIFDDKRFFKKLINPYEEIYKTNLNSKNMMNKIQLSAEGIKERIAKCVEKKMLCLKIDIATRMKKTVVVLNIQYIQDSKIVINTIGVMQFRKGQISQSLVQEEILNCLKEYEIDASQIYYACSTSTSESEALSTDEDGAYKIKTAKLLTVVHKEIKVEPPDMMDTHEEEEEEEANSDDKHHINIHSSLTTVLSVGRCAAHGIQLAAEDVLKTLQLQIGQCRSFASMLQVLKKNTLNLILDDNKTKWRSTYKMLESLTSLRDDIPRSVVALNLEEPDWNFINQFLNAFRPLADCSDKLQREQYVVGDFYRDWLYCEIELEEEMQIARNPYAGELFRAMNERKQNLLANEAFNAALYIDPRFNFAGSPYLNEEQKKKAVHHLLKTQDMMKSLNGESTESKCYSPVEHSVSTSSGPFAKLEAKMNLLMDRTPALDRPTKLKLDNLSNANRMPFETNILDYWKHNKHTDPDLGLLIDVALAVPSTQVSMERALSALSMILTKHLATMSKERINNLILVKLNNNFIPDLHIIDEIM